MKKFLTSSLLLASLLLSSCGKVSYDISMYKKEMNYHDNFKIMQLTDLHFGIEMDSDKEIKHLNKMLDIAKNEKYDLIVITGDSFLDAKKAHVNLLINTIDNANIPWAYTYGNHDFQGQYDSLYINDQIKKAKNAVFVDYDNDNIHGYTNYFINLKDGDAVKYRLFIIDSNSYHPTGFKYGYDIIHDEQIEHIKNIYKDAPATALAFFHIPLTEYQVAYDLYKDGQILGQGENNEPCCPGYTDKNHAFNWLKNCGVIATFTGHDHVNYSDLLYKDMILSYGVKSSDLVYHQDDKIGYKLITLPSDVGEFGLNKIESRFVLYE